MSKRLATIETAIPIDFAVEAFAAREPDVTALKQIYKELEFHSMLRELTIKNLAVIEEVVVPLEPGLNVLTGETGAGKSILVDAILLVKGARAQLDLIRSGEDSADRRGPSVR